MICAFVCLLNYKFSIKSKAAIMIISSVLSIADFNALLLQFSTLFVQSIYFD